MRTYLLILNVIAIAAFGCSGPTSAPTQSKSSESQQLQITGIPVSLTVKQRTTTPVPGSNGGLSMTVDDITQGQAIVSVISTGNSIVLGPISMNVNDIREFQFCEQSYSLELTELNNALIGDDFASFVINDIAKLSEREKIDRLIAAVESIEDAVFIRNGTEHTPKEAASHLRDKLKASGQQLNSTSEFIEKVASRSSITGSEYEIRFANGRVMPAREFLNDELNKLQQPLTKR